MNHLEKITHFCIRYKLNQMSRDKQNCTGMFNGAMTGHTDSDNISRNFVHHVLRVRDYRAAACLGCVGVCV